MQRYRVVILIVLFGVVPVVIAFFAALSYLKDRSEQAQQVETAPAAAEAPPPAPPPKLGKVFAAARDLPVGTLIRDDDLTELALEPDTIRNAHIVVGEEAKAERLRGHAVREAMASGAALTWSALIAPGQQGFLAAVLRPGTRAVTIRVGPATSHAGLIDPGDRVDVILSAELQISERERSVLARTIVEDVRVVAVDRRLASEFEAPADEQDTSGAIAANLRTEMITATLEVSPEQGDRLVLGEHEGKLSLAVRSLAAAAPRTPNAAVGVHELLLAPTDDAPSPVRTVRVYRGGTGMELITFQDDE